ncbi:MAG: HEAT repeat domain-containing protein [Cyanobacteria bacterium]|nr:HEAT repeat domain-containing protein [Cyanobacteriota bacterium]
MTFRTDRWSSTDQGQRKTLNIRYPKENWLFDRPMPDFEFQPYLDFVQRHYSESQGLYTPTDTVLPLKVQSVEKDDRAFGEQGNDRKSSQKLEQFLVLDGLRKYALGDDREHVLLAGRPGSGKSMALKQLAVALAKEGQVPVLIQLKGNVPILDAIADELENGDLEFDAKDIKRLLRHQKLILLLDGINETKDDLRETLQPFRERYQTTPMIFTTRDLAIGGDLGIGKRFEMKPLSPEQLREFVGKYLPGQGERLLKQLSDRLREISETPLVLKTLCDVFDPETDQIPQNKGELFREFDRKYDQFKGSRAVSADFRRFKSEVLQHLAFVMMTGDEGKPTELELTIDRQKAEKAIEDLVTGRISDPGAKAKEWLEDLLEHHLLQVATDDRRVEFRHQLFQEYYAAEALLVMFENRHPDVMEKERFQHFYLNYLKWTETIAIVLSLIANEEEAVRVVKQALDVDLMLGARLAGEVRSDFQDETIGLINAREVPNWLRVKMRKKVNPTLQKQSSAIISSDKNILLDIPKPFSNDEIADLCKLIADRSYEEKRWGKMHEFERRGSKKAIPHLLNLANHPNSDVRHWAAHGLLIFGDHSATKELLKLLKDPSSDVRRSVFFALGRIQDEHAIPVLIESMNDGKLRGLASMALGQIGGKKAVSSLLGLLENPNKDIRWYAIDALDYIGDKSSMQGLIDRLQDSNSDIRGKAAYTLGSLGDKTATPALINNLRHFPKEYDDDMSHEVYGVIETLGNIGDARAIPSLKEFLENSYGYIRQTIIFALGKIGDNTVVPHLIHIIRNGECDSGSKAAKILGKMNIVDAIPDIITFLMTEAYLSLSPSMEVLDSLSNFKDDSAAYALPLLLSYLDTDTDDVVIYAMERIQENCKFYNYEIQQAKLRKADRTSLEGGGVDPFAKIEDKLESIDQSIKMSESSRTFHVQGNYIEKVEGGYHEHNYAPQANLKESEQLIQVLQKLRQQYPNATDAELFEILLNDFQTMPQKNPQNWQSWSNILSILFAGGVEGLKLICPPAGIPIEVGKRLYDIYQKNPKQLPGT